MTKKPVLVDVDDVLMRLAPVIANAMSSATGRQVSHEEWNHNRLHELYGTTKDDVFKIMIAYKVLEQCPPEEGAKEAMELLRHHGHPTILVTKRGFHEDAERITANSMAFHGIPFNLLHVVPFHKPKIDVYRNLFPSFAALIDDQISNLEEAKSANVDQLYLIDRPWNRQCDSFIRSSGIYEAAQRIVESQNV